MFKDMDGITCRAAQHPNVHALFKTDKAATYDVIVTYDMWQPITEEAKKDFLALLEKGKGLVVLHHALASYQAWDEYAGIIGGKFNVKRFLPRDQKDKASTWKHGVHFTVNVADPNHPVTKGVSDFEIHDETYGKFEVHAGVHPLLTTEEPSSGPTIGWSKTYGKSRVVYLALGHDHFAYENPNLQRLIAQAIRWVAGTE
jgi:type 1 glutamine amidotransferase